MRAPMFGSKLFVRAFSVILAVVIVFSVSIYFFATRIVDSTVNQIEEASGRTILNNVYNIAAQISNEQDDFERTALEERRRNLKTAVELGESFIKLKLKEVKAGLLTEAQAKARILDGMRDFRFGNDDYIWIADYSSRLISHPSPELHGKDASKLVDIHGNLIVAPMVAKALAYGDGFHVYWWTPLGKSEPSEKLTYFRKIPELKIVLGAGFYLDDLNDEIKRRKRESIGRLRVQLSGITIANTGYLYIFDGSNRMIIHPNPNIEGQDFGSRPDPDTNIPIAKLLKKAANGEEGVHYKWDKPSDPGNYVYDKISWVRYFPKLDWYIASSVYSDELRSGSRAIGQGILQISLLFLLISSVLGYLFVRNLTQPIIQLSRTAKRVRDGDLSLSSEINRNDEIGELAQDFNAMVERLRDDIEQLDARVHARTVELKSANEKLEQIDKMKSDFMTSVSHEFRTPLTSIRGFLSIIRREFVKNFAPFAENDENLQRKRKFIEDDIDIIEQESIRLTRLINDVLDYTDLISGRAVWREAVFSAAELIDEAAELAKDKLANKAGVELILSLGTPLPSLNADKSRLVQVLGNLLDNAVKFTETGTIELKAGVDDSRHLVMAVTDTGSGISDEQLGHIFSHFHQVLNPDALIDKPSGTGLGLAICKQIVERYGGTILASSQLGKGSSFTISLPFYALDV